MQHFWVGFAKAAKENPEGHYIRRALLGNPLSSAIEAKGGEKVDSFRRAMIHGVDETLQGMGVGAAMGAGLGMASSLASNRASHGEAALLGGSLGGALGGTVGLLYGRFSGEASRIHGEHSKYKKD